MIYVFVITLLAVSIMHWGLKMSWKKIFGDYALLLGLGLAFGIVLILMFGG